MPDPAHAPPEPPRAGLLKDLIRRLGPAAGAAAFTVIGPIVGGLLVYQFATPLTHIGAGLGRGAPVIHALVFAFLCGVAVLPTWVQATLAGFVFGVLTGAAAATGAIVLGAGVGYAMGVLVSGHRAERLIAEHPKWRAVRDALIGSGFWKTTAIVTLVRLPSTPFALTNLVCAAARAPVGPFLLGTLVGAWPRTLLWAFFGHSLRGFTKEEVAQRVPWWMGVLGAAGMVAVLIVLAKIAEAALRRVTGDGRGGPGSGDGPSAR